MYSLSFEQKGDASQVLSYKKTDIPTPLQDELTIKVLASPINPADFMFIEKQYRLQPSFPQIAGFEGAGIVIENGGDNYYPINTLVAFRHKNIWAEYATIPKDKVISLPSNFPLEKAALLSLNPLTAWALIEESKAKRDQWIILTAGGSNISKLIIQFAKRKGIKTLPILRTNNEKERLIQLGATHVLVDNDHLIQEIQEVIQTDETACLLDAVGGEITTKIIKTLSPFSQIIHYGLYSKDATSYHNADIIFKNLTIKGFGIDHWLNSKDNTERRILWKEIISLINQPNFKIDIGGKYSLKDYQQAIHESKNNNQGKTLFWLKNNATINK